MARAYVVEESDSNVKLQNGGTTMSLEITLLIWSVALAFIQMLVAVSAATLQFGLPELAGNREDLPPATSNAPQ